MFIYLAVAGGVALSVVLPLIRALLPKPKQPLTLDEVWRRIWPYVATAVFSLLAAVLILASFGDQLDTWQKALLAGYAADSTLQKLTTGNTSAD